MSKASASVIFTIFLIIINNCCFDFCAAISKNDESSFLQYDIHTELLPYIGPSASLVKLREKRDVHTDDKNQYQAVSQNSTLASANPTVVPASAQATVTDKHVNALTAASGLLPYTTGDQPLLGVNGTGQRKDLSDKQSASKYPKKVLSVQSDNDDVDVDKIDVPENETMTALQNHNFTINQTTDYHDYYTSRTYVNKDEVAEIWNSVKNFPHNQMLSQSHRRAMTVELTFDFPFYGHPVRKITVATGGFLYTGDYVHSWLAATQYIAPLMANFDTSLSNDSFVRFNDNGTAFSVVWENVFLQDKQDVGNFTFVTTLHKSGEIVFAYYKVPILVNAIQDDKHPVKVGLSDAYIIDKVVYFARRKTIYEYHRVNFGNSEITNSTLIRLTPLPTCHSYTDCAACMNNLNTSFKCAWCPTLNKCSTGTDRGTQEWLHKGCDRTQINDISACPALGDKGNNASSMNSNKNQDNTGAVKPATTLTASTTPATMISTTKASSTGAPATANNNNKSNQNDSGHPAASASLNELSHKVSAKPLNAEANSADIGGETKSMGLVLGFMIPTCLVMAIAMWVVYAYRNPHTKSGQLLIQYRPSQWSWRRGEARYTAATIHM